MRKIIFADHFCSQVALTLRRLPLHKRAMAMSSVHTAVFIPFSDFYLLFDNIVITYLIDLTLQLQQYMLVVH